MLVFMDESGDAGFKVAKGSSPVFAVAMVIFAQGEDAMETETRIARLLQDLRVKPEFKFSKCHDSIRDRFFDSMMSCPFAVRAIVVDKARIRSENLKQHTDRFYSYFVKQLMKFDDGRLSQAKVRIDGSGERVFRQELCAHLRRSLGERVKEVRLSNSRSDLLIQLADMCAGAIARSRRGDRPDAGRWERILRPRIGDIWDFE